LKDRAAKRSIPIVDAPSALLKCAAPARLQQLSDSLSPRDLVTCGQKWLACLTPFFTATEREQAGCQHRLFFSQVEFCDNIIFHRRAALDKLGERLLDANRTIEQPDKITIIFGRKVSKRRIWPATAGYSGRARVWRGMPELGVLTSTPPAAAAYMCFAEKAEGWPQMIGSDRRWLSLTE
jgi:hypothetical protein